MIAFIKRLLGIELLELENEDLRAQLRNAYRLISEQNDSHNELASGVSELGVAVADVLETHEANLTFLDAKVDKFLELFVKSLQSQHSFRKVCNGNYETVLGLLRVYDERLNHILKQDTEEETTDDENQNS